MLTSGRLYEHLKIDPAVAPASLSGSATGAYRSMVGFKRALFIVSAEALADGQSVTAQILQAKDAKGDGFTGVDGFSVALTGQVDADKAVAHVEIDGSELTDGFTHVALKLTSDAGVNASAVLIREGCTTGRTYP